jgi:hypothetical protein
MRRTPSWRSTAAISTPSSCDLEIGRFAMIGMGSVVTKSVPAFHLALGHPARPVGCVCRCGQLLFRFPREETDNVACAACRLRYAWAGGELRELTPPE